MADSQDSAREDLRESGTEQVKKSVGAREKIVSVLSTVLLIFAVGVFLFVTWQVRTQGYVNLGGKSLFRVVTGSMEPTITRGALLMSKETPIEDIVEGDVVCYRSREGDTRDWIITHRVVAVRRGADGTVSLETRGDANNASDLQPVRAGDLIGKVVWYTKQGDGLSNFLSFLTSGIGFLALVAVPGFLIASLLLVRSINSVRQELAGLNEALAEQKKQKKQAVPQEPPAPQGLSPAEKEQLRREVLQELLAERDAMLAELREALQNEE